MISKSEQMSRVRSRDTVPERIMRAELSRHGIRYRLHRRDLPGKPDIYIGRLRLAIFVNGCFWHGHTCSRGKRPKSNLAFWEPKLSRNIERDVAALNNLAARGVEAMVLWTCAAKTFPLTANQIAARYKRVK